MIDRLAYYADEIRRHYDDTHWWRERLIDRVVGPTLSMRWEAGENFFERDWDNLFLFDAARADLFEDAIAPSTFDSYERTHSPGSSSAEWMQNCFGDAEYGDVVYVSGNPWVSRIGGDSFHRVFNLWVDEYGLSETADARENILKNHDPKGWGTIKASTLSEAAREAHEEYPDKRLVVHYFQPHAPCIGRRDGSLREEVDHTIGPGENLRRGRTDLETVWEAYLENLLYAYHYASDLAEDVGGKTVYSADHGELMGEWLWPFPMRGYAHPSGLHHPKLLEVPWAVEQHGPRRPVTEGQIEQLEVDEGQIDEHLEDLGYL